MSRLMIACALAIVAGAAGGGWAFGSGPLARHDRPAAPAGAIPVTTATVTAGTISSTEEDSGTIGYQGSFTVYAAVGGTVTWLPAAGTVIRPGGRLFAVDGRDAVLMRGQTPAWRPFVPGMTDGPDVAELQRNLVALGYDPYHGITPDGQYGWATEAAVERWQGAEGLVQDGQIALGQVVFLPGPVRVAGAVVGLGAAVAAGAPVITATSTTAMVTVAIPASEQSAVTSGQRVVIRLPDGGATTGRVLGPAPVSAATAGNGEAASSGGSGGGSASGGSGSGGSGSGGSGSGGAGGPPTVGILVSLDHQSAAQGLDGSPVQVAITTDVQRDALIVPISALLASPGGGFQVTVVSGGMRHDVTIQTGLFDDIDGTVAITGPGITVGTRVEVPRS
jgi:peptidoglycan hydrolase-like protein with peptidoglycan-binding domain